MTNPLAFVQAIDGIVDTVRRTAQDAVYSEQVAAGEIHFDLARIGALIHSLDGELAQVHKARGIAGRQLEGVHPSSEVSDLPGLNSAWSWLSKTAVDGHGLVSLEKNLSELTGLIEFLRDQLMRVRLAYIAADNVANEELDAAAKLVFDRKPPEPTATYAIGLPGF